MGEVCLTCCCQADSSDYLYGKNAGVTESEVRFFRFYVYFYVYCFKKVIFMPLPPAICSERCYVFGRLSIC